MSPRSSLLKRAAVPLLAVAAAAALCAPSRAATATWNTFGPYGPTDIAMRVDLNCSDPSYSTSWTNANFYVQLLGGNAYPWCHPDQPNLWVGAGNDYLDPPDSIVGCHTTASGTYNCWCICTVGNSGGAQYASTGGTSYIDR